MKIEEKKRIAQNLSERFSKAAVVIVTDYKGLDVTSINDLRRKLRQEEVEFQVAKNSLLIRASQETDVALIKDTFKGPQRCSHELWRSRSSPAKILTEFAKENKVFEIKVGVMDGKILDANTIKALSVPAVARSSVRHLCLYSEQCTNRICADVGRNSQKVAECLAGPKRPKRSSLI